jgi:hypothetical protein
MMLGHNIQPQNKTHQVASEIACQTVIKQNILVLGWYLWTLIATKTDKVNKGIYILFGWYLWTLSFTKTAKGFMKVFIFWVIIMDPRH